MNVSEQASQLLTQWIERQSSPPAKTWFLEKKNTLSLRFQEQEFYIAFGITPRKMGKDPLQLSSEDLKQANDCCAGWTPQFWTLDQATRLVFFLSSPAVTCQAFTERLNMLCHTAEVGELLCLYQGLPLYPWPESHITRASEGIRSNIKAVFEAVAHLNPYPQHYLPEEAWNQMVLKALFIGSPLAFIQGIDARSNPTLARMLVDYAHERWAAKRPVSIELWRCVGPHLTEMMLVDIQRLLTQGTENEKHAAILTLRASTLPSARMLLDSVKALDLFVEAKQICWNTLKSS